MFGKLFRSTANDIGNRVIGIDIGSSSIKVVEIKEKDGALSLTTYGSLSGLTVKSLLQ